MVEVFVLGWGEGEEWGCVQEDGSFLVGELMFFWWYVFVEI